MSDMSLQTTGVKASMRLPSEAGGGKKNK